MLVRRLRVLSPGEAMEQNIRQAEKMSRNIERASRAIKVYICMLIRFFSLDCTCIPLKNMLAQ